MGLARQEAMERIAFAEEHLRHLQDAMQKIGSIPAEPQDKPFFDPCIKDCVWVEHMFRETCGSGVTVSSIDLVDNALLHDMIADQAEILKQRSKATVFTQEDGVKLFGDPNKKTLLGRLDEMALRHIAPSFEDEAVKFLPCWHGVGSEEAAQNIAKMGLANLRSTDEGYFGAARYASLDPKYARQYCSTGDDTQVMLLCLGVVGRVYPVTVCDEDYSTLEPKTPQECKYYGKPLKPTFDAHLIGVRGPEYHPAQPAHRAEHFEIAFSADSQVLPVAIVRFRDGDLPGRLLS